MKTVLLSLEELDGLVLDLRLGEVRRRRVESLKELIRSGRELRPILLRRVGGKLQIWNGNHRYVAYKELYGKDHKVKVRMTETNLKSKKGA